MKLQVFAEILGREVLVGFIEGASYREAVFQYTEDYLKSGSGAVSISLPLQEEAFSAMQTRNFFEGLLPEGFSRRAVSRWIKTEEEDYLTILSVLGQECIGALRLTEQGTEEPAGSYELLTSEQVRSLAEEGASRSTRLLVESRLSLAGASGKVGLYFDRENGQWYLPKGKAPSTHIVKQSHVRLEKIVLNEQLCLMTARQMGLEVPDSFIINIGSGNDDEVLFASERYDRRQFSQKNINGLIVPYRLHQEDFGQALGISSGEKYEPSGGMYLRKMFSLLRDYAGNPIEDQRRLWDRIIFSRLIGNTDSHVKNFSLLYGPDLKTVSSQVSARDYVILLCHNPSIIADAQQTRNADGDLNWFDLGLFGHTHGGQMQFFSGLLGIADDVSDRYLSGWFTENRVDLLVSHGVGTSVFPARLFCPPQIHLIEVTAY